MSFGSTNTNTSNASVPSAWSADHGWYNEGFLVTNGSDWYESLQGHDSAANKEPGTAGGAAYWVLKVDIPSSAQIIAAAPAETVTTIGALINSATAKTTLVGSDSFGLMDSESTPVNLIKKLTWTAFKAILDALYAAVGHTHTTLPTTVEKAALKMSIVALTMVGNACTPDFAAGNDFEVTLTGADTINNPSTPTIGQSGVFWVNNSAAGTGTVAWGTYYKFTGGVDGQVSAGANSLNMFAYKVKSATIITVVTSGTGLA